MPRPSEYQSHAYIPTLSLNPVRYIYPDSLLKSWLFASQNSAKAYHHHLVELLLLPLSNTALSEPWHPQRGNTSSSSSSPTSPARGKSVWPSVRESRPRFAYTFLFFWSGHI